MNMSGLTRENVPSQFQVCRIYLRRVSGLQQGGLSNSFMNHRKHHLGPCLPSGQIAAQSFATLQAIAGKSTKKTIISPLVEQKNIFRFCFSKITFRRRTTASKINFFHGIPTNMGTKSACRFASNCNVWGNVARQPEQLFNGFHDSTSKSSFTKRP